MSTKYLTSAPIAILAGFLIVVSQAFHPHVLGWVAVGVAIGIVAVVALGQLDPTRGGVQRALDGATAVTGGLLIAFGVAASGSALKWLTFGLSLGIVGVAFAALTLHEVSTWRAENRLSNLHWLTGTGIEAGSPQSRAA
ncbi:MAG TPA: hypothetical protein VFZ97_08850 [Acidimicrobiales bacterium]